MATTFKLTVTHKSVSARKRTNPEGVMPIREHLRELRKRPSFHSSASGLARLSVGTSMTRPWSLLLDLTEITSQDAILNFDTIGPLDLKRAWRCGLARLSPALVGHDFHVHLPGSSVNGGT